jgi:carboxymethylenebutenolidase
MIEITSSDGHTFGAYRAEPEDEPKGAVVVLQEIFGVNQHVRKITDSFAAQGYVAIAPALFDRVKKGVELSYDEAGLATGMEMMKQAGESGPLADIQAAIDVVKSAGKVAIVGYSWGGYLSYLSANQVQGVACAIGYYGAGITSAAWEKRRIPTLLHFGEKDHLIPREELVQFRALRPDVSVYSYQAGHGFNCEERDTYDEDAASRARERTLFMISQYVEGQGPVKLKNAGSYISQETKKKKKPAAAANDGPPDS